ncbi:MAG: glutamine synthetase, partial [Verrucomicrobiota bacterium]
MAKLKLEYLWLDGYEPVANLRGKTKILDGDPDSLTLADLPEWGFDGSSTL